MNKPLFVGIGASRSGTTSFYKYLCAHPDIQPNLYRKETHHFSHFYGDRDRRWYLSQFPTPRSGEFSPTYLFHPFAVSRMLTCLDGYIPWIIMLVRDPVARAWSDYNLYGVREGKDPQRENFLKFAQDTAKIFEEAHELVVNGGTNTQPMYRGSVLPTGHYSRWIKELYRQGIPSGKLIPIKSEVMFANPARITNHVFERMGLRTVALPPALFKKEMAQPYPVQMPDEVRQWLQTYYEPWNEELDELVGINWRY